MPFANLTETLRALRRFAQPWPAAITQQPACLDGHLASFKRAAGRAPPVHRADAVDWHQALKQGTLSGIRLNVLRRLAWEPAVSLESSYLDHLSTCGIRVDARIQRGLLFSIAGHWDKLSGNPADLAALSRSIATLFEKQGRPLPYPLAAADLTRLPDAIAENAAQTRVSAAEAAARLLRVPIGATPLVSAAALKAVRLQAHLALSEQAVDRDYFYQVLMKSLMRPHVLEALRIIAADVIDRGNAEAGGSLRQMIFKHPDLGDPRLPTTGAYWDRTDPLRKKVVIWLSREDISLFFRVFFRREDDAQGRAEFWLPYAGSVQGVRVVYCSCDAELVQDLVGRYELQGLNKEMFARLSERVDTWGSAFVMRFESAVVVEFSRVNSATYLYADGSRSTLNDVKKFWTKEEFSVNELKNVDFATGRQTHRSGQISWQEKFGPWLAQFGIVAGE